MTDVMMPYLTQLALSSPVVSVSIVGIIVALVSWQRCPRPSLLCLLGCAILLVVTVGSSFLTTFFVFSRSDLDWSMSKLSMVMSVIGLVSSLLRALAVGFLVAGVYAGRRNLPQAASFTELNLLGQPQPYGREERTTDRSGF